MLMQTIGSRIKIAREAKGLTQQQVADHFGIRRVSVTQWESDTTSPSVDRVGELAGMLGVPSEWLLTAAGPGPETSTRSALRSKGMKPVIIPGDQLVHPSKRLPIYAAAMGGNGHSIVTFEEIDNVKMPTILENVRGGYGILITGDSMVPAYRPSDIGLVNPNLPPARDTDVILYHRPPAWQSSEEEAIIKHLVGMNDREWRLEQYNPAQVFTEHRSDWPICHRVVGKYNAR